MIYTININGTIDKRRGKGLVKLWPDKDGYLKFVTTKRGQTFNKIFHRLMYEAFVGDIPEGATVDHIDGDKLNNHPTNLQLLTAIENAIKGNAKHWKLVSPDGEVVDVYNLKKFARDNGLHRAHIYSVALGKPKYISHKGWTRYHDY